MVDKHTNYITHYHTLHNSLPSHMYPLWYYHVRVLWPQKLQGSKYCSISILLQCKHCHNNGLISLRWCNARSSGKQNTSRLRTFVSPIFPQGNHVLFQEFPHQRRAPLHSTFYFLCSCSRALCQLVSNNGGWPMSMVTM